MDRATTLTYFNADETVRDMVDVLESSILSSPGSTGFKIVVDNKSSYPWVLRFDDEKDRDYWLSALSYHKAYGLSKVPRVHMGYLSKKGHIVRSWRKRFFILESTPSRSTLQYYMRQAEDPPYGDGLKGKLDIANYNVFPGGGGGYTSVDGYVDDGGGEDSEDDVDDDDDGDEDRRSGVTGQDMLNDDPQLLITLQESIKKHALYKKYRLRCDTMEEKEAWVSALEAHKAYYALRHPAENTIEDDKNSAS